MRLDRFVHMLVASVSMVMLTVSAIILTPNMAGAITRGGDPDGGEHPYVGLIIFDVGGQPSHRCTGTLVTPTVVVTAGHCTYGTSAARMWFEEDVGAGIPGNGFPFGGGTAVEAASVHTHPQYDNFAFFLFDLGVVILDSPQYSFQYGQLPSQEQLTPLAKKRGRQDTTFTAVGYGLQQIKPIIKSDLVRLKADLRLIDMTGTFGVPPKTSIALSNNANTGGTCFGDSGGPLFVGDTNVIGAVTSFGLNGNCAGTGAGYRIDQPDDLDFLRGFMN
ncbi:trypsin-like serine protease [Primorskyibacter aestuariivivens]|uniref:trypsin-like serine protease n=1 Tax=Primorskyibacter aestuariivivens TaxID=1888912 RepID=UPI0023006C10|nr:trypsin-like serine protease [Primorskyibacter aestuariivivens]MDA7430397.1 trypsin-like serine protease [Primorskyibacter aestuariivivens]